MRQTIVITDLTQMPDGDKVCVVGISENGENIRPVHPGGFLKKYLYINHELSIIPGARIGFEFTDALIQPPHIEDKTFDPNSIISYGFCSNTEWELVLKSNACASVRDVFVGFLHDSSWIKPGANTRSVGTLAISAIKVQLPEEYGRLKYKLYFKDSTGDIFNRPISDLTFRELCYKSLKKDGKSRLNVSKEITSSINNNDRIYLRLGLARPWTQPGTDEPKCYLQVNGIYTFPDYLQGKTFADFQT